MKNNSKITKTLLVLAALTVGSLSAFAQLTERPAMTWTGQYDIKMISSQGMQAVWVNKSGSSITAIRPLTDDEQAGRQYMVLNNEVHSSGQAWSRTGIILPTKPADANNIMQIYADADDDMTTFQSSAAFLDFGSQMACTRVRAAYLYWVSHSATEGVSLTEHKEVGPTLNSIPAGNNEGLGGNAYRTVLFKPFGDTNYTSVTASRTLDDGGERKICFADVTDLMRNRLGGLYWVANLRSGFGKGSGGATSGWTLVVIFEPPNCPPRTIKFWDGMESISSGNSRNITLNFSAGEVPATANAISYLGVAVLDGENCAFELVNRNAQPEFIDISSISAPPGGPVINGSVFKINPFAPGQTAPFPGEPQPCYPVYDYRGTELSPCAYDGVSSSRISTYDPDLGTNGNPIIRMPDQRNTLGYDAHHFRLPAGAVIPAATSVTMKYYAGPQGGTSPFMAYMAIQTLQPDLKFYMTAIEPDVAPGGILTYHLRIENIGPFKSDAGAFIVNPLPIAVDLVPGSIQYLGGKTPPQQSNVTGQGTDNETITMYLPEIAAGTGTIANDWVEIEYKVQVHDLSRTDIWAYGCNRFIENLATLTYKAADGSNIVTGSNAASAGCEGAGVPTITNVVSTALDQQYEQSHVITIADEPGNPHASIVTQIQGGAQIPIVSTLENILRQQYIMLGLNLADLPLYTINRNGFPVPANANFEMVEGEGKQVFTADAILNGGCEEQFTFNLALIRIPDWNEGTEQGSDGTYVNDFTTCAGAADGELNVVVSNGTPGYSLVVTDESSKVMFSGFSPEDYDTFTFVVNGLPAGTYNVQVGDKNNPTGSVGGQVVVADPPAIVPTITSQCTDTGVLLSATATGGTVGGTFEYVWKQGNNIIQNGATYTATAAGTYDLVACSGSCQTQPISVVLPAVSVNTPEIVSILSPNPQANFVATVNPANSAYTYAWAMSQGSIPGNFNGTDITSSLTVSDITSLAMDGNKYKVTVTDPALGCVGTAEGELKAVEAPTVTLNSWTQASCPDAQDGTMTVTINGGTAPQTYNIRLENELGAVVHTLTYTATNPSVPQTITVNGLFAESDETDDGTGVYTWYVTDPYVEIAYGPWTITATPRPVTELTVDDVCFGEQLIATASGGHPSYQWTVNGVTSSTQTTGAYIHNYDLPTTPQGSTVNFEVLALSDKGCASSPAQTATVTLKEVPDPLAQRLPVPFSVCATQGQVLDWFTLVENPDEMELRWYDLPTGGVGESNPEMINLAIPDNYSKYVVAVTDGCPSFRTEIQAVVWQNPRILSITQPDVQRVIVLVTDGAKPYEYDYQGIRGPLYDDSVNGKFELNVTVSNPFALGQHRFLVIDANGCETEGTFNINKTVIVPMPYFSPNDDGDNDVWQIENLDVYRDAHITIEIFDRNGKQILKSTGAEFRGWDGRFNGQLMPSTDYWYLIYVEQTGERITGHFSLKR